MRLNGKAICGIIGFLFLALLLYYSPSLIAQIALWQKTFNQAVSANLQQIKAQPLIAGLSLVGISFLYGLLHALGPGHGKFILAGYLSVHQTQMKTALRLSFYASIAQALVAIGLTSVLVVGLNLSSQYFKLSQLWLERGAILLIVFLALYWIAQGAKRFMRSQTAALAQNPSQIKQPWQIKQLSPLPQGKLQRAVENQRIFWNEAPCHCGHQHMPTKTQLQQISDWKSRLLVVLSIGMRPCTGAIFILFFSYMLDLYRWGIIATLAMGLGTAFTLGLFALLLQSAKQRLWAVGKWYFSARRLPRLAGLGRLIAGVILLVFALGLCYSATQPSTGGALLLGR